MNRREFLCYTSVAASQAVLPRALGAAPHPAIAFTFDDPVAKDRVHLGWNEVNERILAALSKHRVKAALFVCGMRVDSDAGQQLIGAWDRQAHLIGNHSYSHLNFGAVTLAEFAADAAKNEPLIHSYRHFAKLFRYPYFKEGDTVAKREGMYAFLQERGYRIGRATIDASDWAINARLESRIKKDPKADLSGCRDFFLQHIWERAQFYDSLSRHVATEPVRHTVLLHHNTLNALFFDDLLAMFSARDWHLIDAEHAYRDPIYDRQPQILPAGESLIWALAKESGKFAADLRYPGENDTYENPKMDALGL
jgi:peptidoglycan-N-acetylglucosamine deacetylase